MTTRRTASRSKIESPGRSTQKTCIPARQKEIKQNLRPQRGSQGTSDRKSSRSRMQANASSANGDDVLPALLRIAGVETCDLLLEGHLLALYQPTKLPKGRWTPQKQRDTPKPFKKQKKRKKQKKKKEHPKTTPPTTTTKNMLSLRTHGLPLLGGHLVHLLHSLPSGLYEATGLATTTASVIAARCLAVVWSPPFIQLREPLNWL